MNNNGYDNDPFSSNRNGYSGGFYGGYDNGGQGSGDFYTGYDNGGQGTGDFYNGYESGSQSSGGINGGFGRESYSDPFAKDPAQSAYGSGLTEAEINYNVIRAKKILNYDFFGFGGTDMETIRSMHPKARYADASDGRKRLITMLVFAGIFLAIGLIFLSVYISKDVEQTDLLNNSEQIQAQVQHIYEGNKFPESMLNIRSYNVTYRFHYVDNYYGGMDELTLDQLNMVGLSNKSSDEQGAYINVYVHKDDPKRSLLIIENYIGRGFMFFAFFAVITAIFTVVGIKLYFDCISGKTAVYTNEQGVKVYQKLK